MGYGNRLDAVCLREGGLRNVKLGIFDYDCYYGSLAGGLLRKCVKSILV